MRVIGSSFVVAGLLCAAQAAPGQQMRPEFPPRPDNGVPAFEPEAVPPPGLLPGPGAFPPPVAPGLAPYAGGPVGGPYPQPYPPVAPYGPGVPYPAAPVPGGSFLAFERPHPLQEYAWLYNEAPRPRQIMVHDIVTVIVKEQAETTVDNRFNRNRTATLKAELKEFLRIDDDGNLANAALNSPKIDANLQARLQSQGQMVEREGMIYRIAATVVDVLPNGNVVLEARKSMRSNRDVWEYSLTGTLRSEDIYRDNTCLSENIANLHIEKRLRGKVYDSTRIPWGTRLYDWFFPF